MVEMYTLYLVYCYTLRKRCRVYYVVVFEMFLSGTWYIEDFCSAVILTVLMFALLKTPSIEPTAQVFRSTTCGVPEDSPKGMSAAQDMSAVHC